MLALFFDILTARATTKTSTDRIFSNANSTRWTLLVIDLEYCGCRLCTSPTCCSNLSSIFWEKKGTRKTPIPPSPLNDSYFNSFLQTLSLLTVSTTDPNRTSWYHFTHTAPQAAARDKIFWWNRSLVLDIYDKRRNRFFSHLRTSGLYSYDLLSWTKNHTFRAQTQKRHAVTSPTFTQRWSYNAVGNRVRPFRGLPKNLLNSAAHLSSKVLATLLEKQKHHSGCPGKNEQELFFTWQRILGKQSLGNPLDVNLVAAGTHIGLSKVVAEIDEPGNSNLVNWGERHMALRMAIREEPFSVYVLELGEFWTKVLKQARAWLSWHNGKRELDGYTGHIGGWFSPPHQLTNLGTAEIF